MLFTRISRLVPELPVYQNMFLRREVDTVVARNSSGQPPRDAPESAVVPRGYRRRSSPQSKPKLQCSLGVNDRQSPISRSTHFDAQVLLLDEPLAAMGARERHASSSTLIKRFKEKARGVDHSLIAHNYPSRPGGLRSSQPPQKREHRARQEPAAPRLSADELMSIVATEYQGT